MKGRTATRAPSRPGEAPPPSALADCWLWPWYVYLFLVPCETILNQVHLGLPTLLLGLGGAGLLALGRGRGSVPAGERSLAVVTLGLALCVSAVFSVDREASWAALVPQGLCLWSMYLLATATPLRPDQVDRGLRAWLWGGATVAFLTVTAALRGQIGRDYRGTLIIGGTEADPNFLGAGMVLPFAVALSFALRRERRWEGIVLGTLIVAATLFTQSRGGTLALVAVLFACLAWERRPKTLLVVATTGACLYLAFLPALGRFDLSRDTSGSDRTAIWRVGLEVASDRPLTGAGPGTLGGYTSAAGGLYLPLEAHNTYVQALAEEGIPGLLALLLVMGTHLRVGRRAPHATALWAGLAGTAVAGLFLHLLTYRLLWAAWILAAQADACGERGTLARATNRLGAGAIAPPRAIG